MASPISSSNCRTVNSLIELTQSVVFLLLEAKLDCVASGVVMLATDARRLDSISTPSSNLSAISQLFIWSLILVALLAYRTYRSRSCIALLCILVFLSDSSRDVTCFQYGLRARDILDNEAAVIGRERLINTQINYKSLRMNFRIGFAGNFLLVML